MQKYQYKAVGIFLSTAVDKAYFTHR